MEKNEKVGKIFWTAATLKAEFRNSVGLIPVGVNSPSIGGWIVRPPVIQTLGEEPD